MIDILVSVLVGLMMLVGLLGAIIPLLPDVVLIWVGALIYGLVVGWGQSGGWLFGVISVLGLIGLLSDVWVSGVGARQAGATVLTTLGGLAIGLVGLVVAGPPGFLGGILLGTFVLEYWRHRDPEQALRTTFGMGIGYGASFVIKFLLGLGMIAAWVAWLFLR
ncbi:MAG: DUF456 domain-containing protein [Anaerolineales bacterium]|nr:DUF456 domain-containing protein [Anaerolineales bacterium]TFH36235.1 MAG: DUF456 domain-containing protein [Anaerolineales bacterium]